MVLVADFGSSGHHLHMLRCLNYIKHDINLLTTAKMKKFLEEDNVLYNYITPVEDKPDSKNQWKIIIETLKKNKHFSECFHITIDIMDSYTKKRIFNPKPFSYEEKRIGGLTFKGNFWYRRNVDFIRFLKCYFEIFKMILWFTRASKARFAFLNEDLANVFKKIPWLKNRISFCPDPIDFYYFEKNKKNYSADEEKSILFFGGQERRKGTEWALKILLKHNFNHKITIAGKVFEKNLKEFILESKNYLNIEFIDEYVCDNKMFELFSKTSVVVIPYIKFGGSSSILLWALFFNKPVLVTNFGLLPKRIESYKNGLLFNPDDELDFYNKLIRLIEGDIKINNGEDIIKSNNNPVDFSKVVLNINN